MYVSLLAYGPSPAKPLVPVMEINRVDVYRILRSLTKKGLVEVYLGTPSKYAAIVPERAIDSLTKEKENHLSKLKDQAVSMKRNLDLLSRREHVPSLKEDTTQNHFKLKYGRQVLDTREKLLNEANHEILVIWSGIGLKIHSTTGLLHIFEKAAARGVKIRAITEFTDELSEEIGLIQSFTSLRIGENLLSTLRSMIVDSKEVLLSATSLPAEETELIALWTDNRPIVGGFIRDFERLWESSVSIDRYLLQMKTR